MFQRRTSADRFFTHAIDIEQLSTLIGAAISIMGGCCPLVTALTTLPAGRSMRTAQQVDPGSGMRRCVGPRMSQEYVMSQTSLEELLLQNPNAPTNDEYALHFARQLYARREERDGERLVLAFAEETKEFDASDDEQVEWCGESTYGLLDAVLASTLLSSEARAEINAMMEDAAPPWNIRRPSVTSGSDGRRPVTIRETTRTKATSMPRPRC